MAELVHTRARARGPEMLTRAPLTIDPDTHPISVTVAETGVVARPAGSPTPAPAAHGDTHAIRPAILHGTTPAAARHSAKLWRAYHAARRRLRAENPSNSGPGAHSSPAAVRCDATRNALVEHYQPLVGVIAGSLDRRLPRSVDRGDLETAANVGLMSAIEAYDPARGVPFELYAEHRLRGALLDELRNLDWLPRPWRARLEARRRAIERLSASLGREPWDEEVAADLAIPVHVYQQDYGRALIDSPVAPNWADDWNSNSGSVLDGVPDRGREAPEERLTRDDLLRLVAQKLTAQEYRVVYLKYWEEMPLREIGTVLGLSESRVCKIHMALLDRLRDKLSADSRD